MNIKYNPTPIATKIKKKLSDVKPGQVFSNGGSMYLMLENNEISALRAPGSNKKLRFPLFNLETHKLDSYQEYQDAIISIVEIWDVELGLTSVYKQ